MRRNSTSLKLLPLGAALLLSACNGSGAPTVPPGVQNAQRMIAAVARHSSSSKIQHIVIIVQENRSFNNLFYGFRGAHTAKFGYNTSNQKIELQPVGLETRWDIEHDLGGFLAACNGTGSYPGTDCQNNGFDNESWGCGNNCPNQNPPYSYVPHTETKPYIYLGKHYVLADEMYASNLDASSFISHQYIIAGQASSAVNFPNGWWGCEGVDSGDNIYTLTQERTYGGTIPMCWSNDTIGEEMDNAKLSWAFYACATYTATLVPSGALTRTSTRSITGPTGRTTSSRRRPTSSTTFPAENSGT